MGTWSTDSFGNDAALDWFAELQAAGEFPGFIAATIDTGTNETIIAAGEVLAALDGKPGPGTPPDVVAWCSGKPAPDTGLTRAASEAIQAILDDPDADVHDAWAEGGEDDEDYIAWLAALRDIQARLRSSSGALAAD